MKLPKPERSPDELAEMEGSISDLKQVEQEGLEGHTKGGADVKFVSKEQQAERKEALVKDVDKNFAEYIKTKAVLVAKKDLFLRLDRGEIQADTRNNYLKRSVVREVIYNSGKKGAHYQMNSKDEFLVCLIDEQGNMYKLSLKISEIPGAADAIAEDPRFHKHPINFLEEEFKLSDFNHMHIGQYHYLTGAADVKLETLFKDLESIPS